LYYTQKKTCLMRERNQKYRYIDIYIESLLPLCSSLKGGGRMKNFEKDIKQLLKVAQVAVTVLGAVLMVTRVMR
jgi:hypothetical protein